MNKNITLDFTANKAMEYVTANQPLAIMPAELAKRLLVDYAKKLQRASAHDIIITLISGLQDADLSNSVSDAVEECALFIQERSLIDNCAKENWGAFTVPTEDKIGKILEKAMH